jgi:antirestriction protein ArdC
VNFTSEYEVIFVSVYDVVTEKIIHSLEEGVVPWKKTWLSGYPLNLVSKKEYSGLNSMLLGMQDYESPFWLTFKQCKNLGGRVKSGEKSFPVIFWKPSTYETGEKDERGRPVVKNGRILRYYLVFNSSQCSGLELPDLEAPKEPIVECEKILGNMKSKPEILHERGDAYYVPRLDEVHMPPMANFKDPQHYYATLFHELLHSTGHDSRLKRAGIVDPVMFGSEKYSEEELIAEVGASYLCSLTGIHQQTEEINNAYIGAWLERLQKDKKMIVGAASKAQKAVDYIRGIQ